MRDLCLASACCGRRLEGARGAPPQRTLRGQTPPHLIHF